MYEVIENILTSRRTEERYTPLLGLVSILDEMGYEDSLLAVTSLAAVAVDSDTLLDDTERLIINNSLHLLRRLGITVDNSVNKEVDFLHALLDWIVKGLDDSENIDEILDIVNSEEPAIMKIADITTLFTGLDHVNDVELVHHVEDRFMLLVKNNINSRKESELAKVDEQTEVDIRMHKYIQSLNQDGQIHAVFSNGAYKTTKDEFIQGLEIDLSELPFEERIAANGLLIAGIQIAFSEDVDEALDMEDVISVVLSVDDEPNALRVSTLAQRTITRFI